MRNVMGAVERLQAVLPDVPAHRQDFAKSLIHQFQTRASLSERQVWWVDKLIFEATAVVEDVEPTYPNLLAAFAEPMRKNVTRAALRSGSICVSLAARQPGSLYVKLDGEYAGKITPEGKFKRASGVDLPGVTAALAVVEANPVAAAYAYGRETGRCSICGRELTDPESVARGIGPICVSLLSW